MPYIKTAQRNEVLGQGLNELVSYLATVPVEMRKGFVAYVVAYVAKYSFKQNYFGISTGIDAIRSAYDEMKIDLATYEIQKRTENGGV